MSGAAGGAGGAGAGGTGSGATGGEAPPCAHPEIITAELLAEGGLEVAKKVLGSKKAGDIPRDELPNWGEGGDKDSFYVISIGPDGLSTVPLANHMAEDKDVIVVIYRPVVAGYSVTVTGCQAAPIRVLGSLADTRKPIPKGGILALPAAPIIRPYATKLGRCSADSTVTVTVKVPEQPHFCPAESHDLSFTTDPVYAITVGVGGTVALGHFKEVGVTPGLGGGPGKVFERTENADFNVSATVMWYPAGFNPHADFGLGRFFIGTAVPLTWPPSNLNVLVGVAPVPGLQLSLGGEFLRHTTFLDDGLRNGSVFNDDSSTLPTHKAWRAHGAFVMNLSLGTDLLTKIVGH